MSVYAITTVPFQGFYNSVHDGIFDDCLDRMFSDHETGAQEYCNISCDDVHMSISNISKSQMDYAKLYTEKYSEESGYKLFWESMTSPKFYNFETDRLFAYIGLDDVSAMLQDDVRGFSNFVRSKFASRDGFISHYSNNLSDWGNFRDWDHNQMGALLEYHNCHIDELSLMSECLEGNCIVDNFLLDHNPDLLDLVNKHDDIERAKQGD